MDANKKVELEHAQCPSESKILLNIIKNHPLRFSIAASASVPWIYMLKLTEHYKMYVEVFGLDVPLTQSQPTKSTQGSHKTPSAPRSPNPATETAESSVPKRSTVIRFRLPSRQSARLTPPVPVPSAEKADEMILQDMIQEIEKLVEDTKNVDDSSPPRHDDTSIPGTRLEPRSDKESPKVEIVQEKEEETTKDTEVEPDKDTPMVDVTNIVPPINVDDEEDEITDEVFELRRRVKGKNVEETRISPIPSPTRSPRNLSTLVSSDTEKLQELTDDPHDDAHLEGENSAKRQKTSEYEAYVSGESSSGQVNVEEPGPSTSGNQEQDDEFDFWTDSYASDDDEIPTKQVTQDIMEEISLTIDEAKLKKMADEMLRQRCTSGDEHQYHIDQMKNFLQSDIVWESRKEILVSPHPRKITPLVQSCQRDPEAPALSLINQDLLYLKKGNSGPEKIVLSLHKFPAIIFNDDDIEERTSRWVNKCIKKFNPYARYGVENWKNPHAKIFYIRRQKEPGRPKEEIYSNSKIVQVIKTFWELGHEHKFITEIVARRANDCIVSITEPDYKNLNKNDIEDIKKEKRVMRPSEIHKFCDATLRRTLEGLKSYYNDVKYGYVQKELTNDEVEFLKLFEEEIEVRLNYRDQMRRWEMYIHVTYHQLWRAILTLINQCLTGKTSGSDKPRHHVFQMLWGIITRSNVDYAELLWEEFGGKKKITSKADKPKKPTSVKQPALAKQTKPVKEKTSKPSPSKKIRKGKPALAKQTKPVKEKTSKPSPSKKIRKGKVMKVRKGKRTNHLVDEEDEEPQTASEIPVEDDEYNLQRGKWKGIATDEQAAQSLLDLQKPKKQNDTSINVVHDTSSPADVESGADTEKSTSKVDTEIFNDDEEHGEEVSRTVALEERTVELDEGQAGSDPSKTPES
ncbi:hypothetical protein Tco_0668770 [Tanacetum coccineum]